MHVVLAISKINQRILLLIATHVIQQNERKAHEIVGNNRTRQALKLPIMLPPKITQKPGAQQDENTAEINVRERKQAGRANHDGFLAIAQYLFQQRNGKPSPNHLLKDRHAQVPAVVADL